MDHVVVDVEITKAPTDCTHGWASTEEMGVAVACLWEYGAGRMRIYGPEEGHELRQRLLAADRITGFNIWKFDLPVIWGLSQEQWFAKTAAFDPHAELRDRLRPKTDDLLRRIWKAQGLHPDGFSPRHAGWSLDRVAQATLGLGKIGHGAEAPKWHQAGLVHKVANYCADDVALERDLCDYMERYGRVLNDNRVLVIPPWDHTA